MKKIHSGGPVLLILALLTLSAYGLRMIGAESSIAYIPDTEIIRQALDLGQKMASTATYDIGLSGAKYPFGLSWILLGVYGVIFIAGMVSGQIGSMAGFENLLFVNRTGMHMVAVLSLGVITAAIVPLLFVVSRRLNSAHRGWLAAGMGAFSLLMVHLGHQVRPHASLAVFALASVALLVAVSRGADKKWCVAATLCSAMTLGTLQNGIVILLPFFLAWLFRILSANRRLAAVLEGALNTILLSALAFVLYPNIFREFGTIFFSTISGRSTGYSLGAGAHYLDWTMFSLANIPVFIKTIFDYQPLLVLAAPAAVAYFLWKFRGHPRELAVGIAFPLIQLAVWATFANSYARITLILTPFFILPVAYGLEDLLSAIRDPRRNRRFYAAVCAVILLPMLITALRLDYVLAQTDTRTQASRWVESNLPENSVILANAQMLELTRTRGSIEAQQEEFPGSIGTYDQWLLDQDDAADPSRRPAFDILNGYLWEKPSVELMRSRGVEYLLIITKYADPAAESNPWLELAMENGTLVQSFCPARNVNRFFLPEEIQSLAAAYVWEVERPGPIVLLFRMGGGSTPQGVFCSN